jgi:TonB family protein
LGDRWGDSWPRPFLGRAERWRQHERLSADRLRRAAIFAIAVHLISMTVLMIFTHRDRRPPRRMVEIPVHLVNISQPPAIRTGGGARALNTPVKPKQEKPDPKQAARTTKTPSTRQAKPVPVKKTAQPAPDLARETVRGDTTETVKRDVAFGGGARGSLEMTVDGPLGPYAYYLMAVRDKVATYWNPPSDMVASGKEVAAMVNFRIDRKGKVTASYVEEPSGTGVFDQAGLRAIAMANPLPPLPQDYTGDWLGIHLRFVYKE